MSNDVPYLTKQGPYVISIGFYLKDGKRTQKKFRLGRDRSAALRQARALRVAWDDETTTDSEGKKIWSQQSIDRAFAFADPASSKAATTIPNPGSPSTSALVPVFTSEVPRPAVPVPAFYTLPQALDEFNRFYSARSDIGEKQREVISSRVKSIKAHVEEIVFEQNGVTIWLKDLPVSQVEMEWLDRIRNRVTSRPLTRYQDDGSRRNHPISLDVVENWLKLLGMAFDWFDRTTRIGWRAPHHRWREAFTLRKKQKWALMTPDERDNDGKPKPTFTLDEIAIIFKASTKLTQKYLLMGLMLGWTQKDISTFRKSHFVKSGYDYYIDRRRGKTGIEGFWWVCPELAKLLIESISNTPANGDNLAFLTEEGMPLVHGNTDSIGLAWGRALNTANKGSNNGQHPERMKVRRLPFARLRKLGGQIVENLSLSHDLAQLFLAHTSGTIARKHYVGTDVNVGIGQTPYERLHEVQQKMYEALKPILFGGTPAASTANPSNPEPPGVAA